MVPIVSFLRQAASVIVVDIGSLQPMRISVEKSNIGGWWIAGWIGVRGVDIYWVGTSCSGIRAVHARVAGSRGEEQ